MTKQTPEAVLALCDCCRPETSMRFVRNPGTKDMGNKGEACNSLRLEKGIQKSDKEVHVLKRSDGLFRIES